MNSLCCLAVVLATISLSNGFVLFKRDEEKQAALPSIVREKRSSAAAGPGSDLIALIDGMFIRADVDENDGLDSDEFWATFAAFDGNDDQIITLREYVAYFNIVMGSRLRGIPIGPTSAILFSEGDMNGDRRITKTEDAEIIFLNLDQDNDAFISKEEYFNRWQQIVTRINLRTQARGKAPVEEIVEETVEELVEEI